MMLDVRGPEEFSGEMGHVRGARIAPLAELSRRLAELSRFREHKLALVCDTEVRSVRSAAMLARAGFRNLMIPRGGMGQWIRRGFEIAHHDHP